MTNRLLISICCLQYIKRTFSVRYPIQSTNVPFGVVPGVVRTQSTSAGRRSTLYSRGSPAGDRLATAIFCRDILPISAPVKYAWLPKAPVCLPIDWPPPAGLRARTAVTLTLLLLSLSTLDYPQLSSPT